MRLCNCSAYASLCFAPDILGTRIGHFNLIQKQSTYGWISCAISCEKVHISIRKKIGNMRVFLCIYENKMISKQRTHVYFIELNKKKRWRMIERPPESLILSDMQSNSVNTLKSRIWHISIDSNYRLVFFSLNRRFLFEFCYGVRFEARFHLNMFPYWIFLITCFVNIFEVTINGWHIDDTVLTLLKIQCVNSICQDNKHANAIKMRSHIVNW